MMGVLISFSKSINDFYKKIPAPKLCNSEIIELYSGIGTLGASKERHPMAVSDLLMHKCPNIDSSCCTDPEFEQMTGKIRSQFQKIVFGIKEMQEALEIVKNLNEAKMNDFVSKYIKTQDEKKKRSKEKYLYKALNYVMSNSQEISNRMSSFVELMKFYSINLNCALCMSKNHIGLQPEIENKKLLLNSNMCTNLFNSLKFNELTTLISDFSVISLLDNALSTLYGLEFDFSSEMMGNFQKEVVETKNKCNSLNDQIIDSPECLSMCYKIIPFNGSPSKIFEFEQSVFVILVKDFFGRQTLYTKINSKGKAEGKGKLLTDKENESEEVRQVILKFSEKIHVDYFLRPTDLNHKLNLNNMQIEYSKTQWYLRNTRYHVWKTELDSSLILKTLWLIMTLHFFFTFN
jgi:hypothetical protein